MTNTGLLSKKYKQLIQLNIKKTMSKNPNNPIKNGADNLQRNLPKKLTGT